MSDPAAMIGSPAEIAGKDRQGSMRGAGACAIRTSGLKKIYGKRTVVDGVDVSVAEGEVVGLLGPNGAGKTTTFYMVVGQVRPNEGNVFLGEKSIRGLPMYRRARMGISYLPQEPSVFRKLSVRENILAVLQLRDLSRTDCEEAAEKFLQEMHLDTVWEQKAYTLSGGERRRLEIARALAIRPRFILMDEPFSGVDPISVQDVQEIIRRLRERGIGILITDHNVRETLRIVDRAYLLYEGRILREGSKEFLINDEQSRALYLGRNFSM